MQRLEKTVALITGAASGLGKGTMLHLLNRGAKAILAFDREPFNFELPKNVVAFRGDVTNEKDVSDALDVCKRNFGPLNVVVNCAGVTVAFKLFNFERKQAHSLQEFRKVIETNVLGMFNVNRLAAGLLAENELEGGVKGVIINTAGASAFEGSIGQVAHSAASGAVSSMTLPMARDLAEEGIRVVAIAPGVFRTPLIEKYPESALQYLADMTLAPSRLGNPDEFGQLVATIIENPMLNGEVIRLDGGIRLPG
ncbi:3-hydroxyacyl-CoA dehydrogenase type-2-like protein [Dinothrombium tinctorium]|uniref:3-hydroxyacyl-CoA dehydrogenase type-2-like protein n=1 Tax=Dinothrombium tinctorium TaxID=1965070 RepID=A0A443RNV0_9ACAR|nr:3-hydroxyacyl-CoA dehydrogenase type-2-like protein [Dinothrombium tinctorium]